MKLYKPQKDLFNYALTVCKISDTICENDIITK